MRTYGSGIVGLAKVTVDTRGRSGVNDTAILLLEEVRPGSLGGLVGTAQVDVHDRVPEVVVHVGESLVTEDTSVVDEDVDAAEGIDGTLDDSLTVFSRSLDTSSLTAELLDLVDNVIRVDEIVDDNGSTSLGESQSVGAADTSTSTSDESNLAGEVDLLALGAGAELLRLLEQSHEVVGSSRELGVLLVVTNLVPLVKDSGSSVAVVGLEEETLGALPADLAGPATTDLEDAAVLLAVLVDEGSNEGNNELGLESLENIRGHDGSSHSASGNGSNDVGVDVVLGTLLGEGLSETDLGELGSRVVGLAEATEETGSRGGVDDTAVLLLSEVRPGGAGNLVGTGNVDLHDQVPVLVGEVLEADITENTGIVDDDVDAAESLDGSLDDLVAVLDAVVVGDSLAASGLDLIDNNVGSLIEEKRISLFIRVLLRHVTVSVSFALPLWSYPRP